MKKIFLFFACFFCSSVTFASTNFVVAGPAVDLNISRINGSPWGLANSYGVTSIYHPGCTSAYYPQGRCHPSLNLTDFTKYDIASLLQQTVHGSNAICIGGGYCGESNTFIITYPASTWVSTIKVYAHDAIGASTKAHLELWVNGAYVSWQDVKSAGGWIEFPVAKYTNKIEFKSVQERGTAGGDESVISRIVSY